MGKTYYYTDEVNDDFAGTNIDTITLPENYEFIPKSKIRKVLAWCLFHLLVQPICALVMFVLGQKIIGREKLKPYQKSGYFLYGNHTRAMGDAFTPSLVSFPKKAYIIVNPDAVSIKGLGRIVQDLGAIPVPTTNSLRRKFCLAVEERVKSGSPVVIYPEAHIWPLYTGIREFPSTSFLYPVKTNHPSFTFTTTYHKRKLFGGVKATVYIDGPFFPDQSLPKKEQKQKLRDEVHGAMVERSKLSTYSQNEFIKQVA